MQSPRILAGLSRQSIGRKFAPSLGAKNSKSSIKVDDSRPESSPQLEDRIENAARNNEAFPGGSQPENPGINSTTDDDSPNHDGVEMRATVSKRVVVTSTSAALSTTQSHGGAKKQKIIPVLGTKSEALASAVHKPNSAQGSMTRALECEKPPAVSNSNNTGNQLVAPTVRSRKVNSQSKSRSTSKISSRSETGCKLRDFEAVALLSRPHSVLPLCFGEKRSYTVYTVYLHRLPPPVGLGLRLKNVEGKAVVKGFSSPPEMSAEAVKSAAAKQTLLSALAVAGSGGGNPSTNTVANTSIRATGVSGSGPNEDENDMLPLQSQSQQNKAENPNLNPAYAAGVRINDVIVSVNNTDARTASFDRIVRALVGTGATSSSGAVTSTVTAPITSSTPYMAVGAGIDAQQGNASSVDRSESSVASIISATSGVTPASAPASGLGIGLGLGSRGMGIAAIDHIVCIRFARPDDMDDPVRAQDIVLL
jgi:hypothetical protein